MMMLSRSGMNGVNSPDWFGLWVGKRSNDLFLQE
jgi:hypothetical protein